MSVAYANNIYINTTLYNNTDLPIVAEKYQNRDQPYINKLEDYFVRLVSATISTSQIPLFKYYRNYEITLTNGDDTKTRIVIFEDYYHVWTVPSAHVIIVWLNQFIDGLNETLRLLTIDLGSPFNPPKFIYQDNKFKLVVDAVCNMSNNKIMLNYTLANKLIQMSTKYVSSTNLYSLVYSNNGINYFPSGISADINYPVIVQEAISFGYQSLQEYNKILVVSNNITINKQLITVELNTNAALSILDTIPIDFDSLTEINTLKYEQKYPNYTDILSSGPLSEIDFQLYVVDSNYKIEKLFLEPGTSAELKIEFINKQMVKNFYPKF